MGFLNYPEFDSSKPANTDSVRFGAAWIRDIKARLQQFAAPMFNLETGQFKSGVVSQSALADMSPSPAGTYSTVRVNSKGLVTGGTLPASAQTAQYYRAVFFNNGAFEIEKPADSTHANPWVYKSTAAFHPDVQLEATSKAFNPSLFTGTYSTVNGIGGYFPFKFTIPSGVSRVKATIVAGGGAAYWNGTNWLGGGGGSLIEVTFYNLPSDGTSYLTLYVGSGGTGSFGTQGQSGCPSRVTYAAGSVYAEAGPGNAASSSGAGSTYNPICSSSLAPILSVGGTGALGVGGASGSTYLSAGSGGTGPGGYFGAAGLILLEWIA